MPNKLLGKQKEDDRAKEPLPIALNIPDNFPKFIEEYNDAYKSEIVSFVRSHRIESITNGVGLIFGVFTPKRTGTLEKISKAASSKALEKILVDSRDAQFDTNVNNRRDEKQTKNHEKIPSGSIQEEKMPQSGSLENESYPLVLHTQTLRPLQLVGIEFDSEVQLDRFLDAFEQAYPNVSYELPNLKTVIIPNILQNFAVQIASDIGLEAKPVQVKSPDQLDAQERRKFELSRKQRVLGKAASSSTQ